MSMSHTPSTKLYSVKSVQLCVLRLAKRSEKSQSDAQYPELQFYLT